MKLRWTWGDLETHVSRLQQALASAGICPGDRVAGLLPNRPEAIAAMLATVSLGGVWCSASPDFGARAILDRFGQIKPKVLFVTDGYWYASSLPFAHTATTREADLPVKFHAENTPALPANRKGQSGKVLLCPQQDYPATSVAHFCIAVPSHRRRTRP